MDTYKIISLSDNVLQVRVIDFTVELNSINVNSTE